MLKGAVSPSAPARLKTFDSCQYCLYRAICHFEPQTANGYRELQMLENELIWQAIEEQVIDND